MDYREVSVPVQSLRFSNFGHGYKLDGCPLFRVKVSSMLCLHSPCIPITFRLHLTNVLLIHAEELCNVLLILFECLVDACFTLQCPNLRFLRYFYRSYGLFLHFVTLRLHLIHSPINASLTLALRFISTRGGAPPVSSCEGF